MKLTHLRALVAAIEQGSLRAAARQLGVSQPALTKMLRELERELATTLLLRSTTGVLATAQGMVLYERALAADRELTQAVDQIQQLGGRMTGSLAIGAVPLAVMLLVPETLRTFGREFPQIQLRIFEELYIEQLTRLRKGEVDIALGPLPEHLPAGEFAVETLMPIDMVIIVRKGNPAARARRLADLAELPWVYTGATAESGYAKILYESHGMKPPPAGALVNSTLGLLSLIASGNYVGLQPRQIAQHPFARQYLDIVPVEEGPLKLTLVALARADTAIKPSVRHFLAHLHRAAHHLTKADAG
ncbi:LysR substrate-binding domain-containing protein [Roseateles asaccharophilus]|uniref:DNA-binding transcriptional LysR family regulator n=1 Tax=Roseateles asaccharophilus TaxID=582607 RepID=A0ABU2A4N0_9BURK|nr:LysR substrate-binding domain-containing protein [Roseateles asaccharophilus]MDR7332152.1 DNA-binding transcriptional LysR family regulator [Roseateles asaccharophilus]